VIQLITQLFFSDAGVGYDNKASDILYSIANKNGVTPPVSDRVVFLTINDLTYEHLNSNLLDRKFLARALDELSGFSPDAVMYDLIFARPSTLEADTIFAKSIQEAGNVCLPAGFSISFKDRGGLNREGAYYDRLKKEFLVYPQEKGDGIPFIAGLIISQEDLFANVATTFGHITPVAESDGVYRLIPMLIKIDSGYIPTATFAMFCKIKEVDIKNIKVTWGENITVPATKESKLETDLVIPIDEHGRTYIPYPISWQADKRKMEISNFLKRAEDTELRDELTEFFEGKVVFIGDVATGISDMGATTLDEAAPLVVIHAAMMNAMMTDSFYSFFSKGLLIIIILAVTLILLLLATFRNGLIFNITAFAIMIAVIPMAYLLMSGFIIFPIVTLQANILFCYIVLLVTIQYAASKEQSFIKSAFSRYLSPTVVNTLIENRESLTLGGEERELTILFSDIAGFTTISEGTKPHQLVKLLNEYFTAMTTIVTDNGGIIDKYIGDAIMAEFGAPLHLEGHALCGVRAALQMQKKCAEMNKLWSEQGNHEIKARIGLNSGLVILGNMGSDQVFDYTVIGDSVNLASRLEGAGKVYGCNILISESVQEKIDDPEIKTRFLDFIKVKGKTKAVKVFEVVTPEVYDANINYYNIFENALSKYFSKEFEEANKLFNDCLNLKINDPAAKEFLKRINYFYKNEPPADWDGAFEMKEK
jgi:adenylate cyclase